MEFCGIVKHILRELSERPLIIVPPTTVKSLFVGKGNCNKEAMLIKANQVLPKYYESINNNNIADAFAIAYIASRCYSDITFRDFTLTKVSIY
jgi:Holliday junction resolvasome RuvABC endonuclease subunit